MAQKRRIRDLVPNRKRFAICNETIEKGGWIRHVLCDDSGRIGTGSLQQIGKENPLTVFPIRIAKR